MPGPVSLSHAGLRASSCSAMPPAPLVSWISRSRCNPCGCGDWVKGLATALARRSAATLAAVSLHVAFYNFCRTHEALRMTPAMALGITDHVWSIAELIETVLKAVPTKPTNASVTAPIFPGNSGRSI